MSKVYRSWSSEAVVKWKGSIGFQQSAFCRVCIVIFCIALPLLTSYLVRVRVRFRVRVRVRVLGLGKGSG